VGVAVDLARDLGGVPVLIGVLDDAFEAEREEGSSITGTERRGADRVWD
jgi:hypothetical protein